MCWVLSLKIVRCVSYGAALFCCVTALMPPRRASAQDETRAYWSLIEKADTRVRAARIAWTRTRTVKPNPQIDAEKQVAKSLAAARERGESAAQLQELEEALRVLRRQDAAGFTQSANIVLLREGAKMRCDTVEGPPISTGMAPGSAAYLINFFDGKNVVYMDSAGTSAPASGFLAREGDIISPQGDQAISGFTNPFEMALLGAIPITRAFPPRETSLHEGLGGTLLLERKIQKPNGYKPLYRLTVSRQTWRPTRVEEINTEDNKRFMSGGVASGYRKYPGGIWLPDRVAFEPALRQWRIDYALQSAALNERAALTDLRLPSNARITDRRMEPPPTYQIGATGEIPSEDELRRMVGKQRQLRGAAAQAGDEGGPSPLTTPLTFGLGAVLVAAGVLLMRRSGHKAA